MYFYERRKSDRWWPVLVPAAPNTKTVAGRIRLVTLTGLGEEVRNVSEIHPRLATLDLDVIASIYGADGRYRPGGPSDHGFRSIGEVAAGIVGGAI